MLFTSAGQLIVSQRGSWVSAARSQNTPPANTWLVDYDSLLEGPKQTSHVGDVAIYRDCCPPEKAAGFNGEYGYLGNLYGHYEESWPGWTPSWTPPPNWTPPPWRKPKHFNWHPLFIFLFKFGTAMELRQSDVE